MKVLGVIFSSRKQGNCTKCMEYCLDKIKISGYEVEIINVFDYEVEGCGDCNYHCFENGACCKEDDIPELYRKCFETDKIVFAIPTFSGHLASSYFKFWERSQSLFKDNIEYENNFLKKINLIIIGNISSGGDMALHEALYSFTNREFYPEVILLSSKEYSKSSIKGNLIESNEVKNRLNSFSEKIINAR
jgi:multimeric flavodoxin WrbA